MNSTDQRDPAEEAAQGRVLAAERATEESGSETLRWAVALFLRHDEDGETGRELRSVVGGFDVRTARAAADSVNGRPDLILFADGGGELSLAAEPVRLDNAGTAEPGERALERAVEQYLADFDTYAGERIG